MCSNACLPYIIKEAMDAICLGYIAARMVGVLRRQVIERKELSKATKLRVINAMVVPTLLYGSETWTLQKRHRSNRYKRQRILHFVRMVYKPPTICCMLREGLDS